MTHAGLSAGFQTAQVAHAVADFAATHTDAYKDWHENSNYIVVLETPHEEALHQLTVKADGKNIEHVTVREPDINHALTAVLFLPGEKNRSFLSGLPCLGKNDSRQEHITDLKETIRKAKEEAWEERDRKQGFVYSVGWDGPWLEPEDMDDHEHNDFCSKENDICWHESYRTRNERDAQSTANRWGVSYASIKKNPYKKETK